MFDFLRVSTAVPNVSVADVKLNTKYICEKIKNAADAGSSVVVLPELCVTGYTCADLCFQNTLLSSSIDALKEIISVTFNNKIISIVGCALKLDQGLYNCGVVIANNKVCGIVPKTLLPNYAEFCEKRWFNSAFDFSDEYISSSQIGLSDDDYLIPVGNNLVFNVLNNFKFGVEICEDLLTAIQPSTFLNLGGAEIIFNLSASNELATKRQLRKDCILQKSIRDICAYAYCSAGYGESTSDLIYSGHSIIVENGTVEAENNKSVDGNYILTADIDLGKIRYDRMKNTSFKDTAVTYANNFPTRLITIDNSNINCDSDGQLISVNKSPFIPTDSQKLKQRCLEIFNLQVAGLMRRMEITDSKAVIGVSGGLDSTLALLVAVKACQLLNRPLTNVYGITMPCFGTSDRTFNNSLKLIEKLGISCKTINIKDACIQHFEDIGHDINIHDITYENSQARERTQVIMDYAGKIGGFVIGTGDLSELALGWCTYNGDHMSMYSVNCDVPKTLISKIIKTIIDENIFNDCANVLEDILNTPISPELLPPDTTGKISQVTEDIVGPYALHDFFIYYCLRYGFSPKKIYFLAKKAFSNEFTDAVILKWLKTFYKRFFSQQFKRNCQPDGVKVGSVSLSPRGDWKMPSDAVVKLWLNDLENL